MASPVLVARTPLRGIRTSKRFVRLPWLTPEQVTNTLMRNPDQSSPRPKISRQWRSYAIFGIGMSKRSQQTLPKTFEDALRELEEILSEIENGNVGLEESLVKYERGNFLIQHCRGV